MNDNYAFETTAERYFMDLPTAATFDCPLRVDILQRLHAILVGAERCGPAVFLGFDLRYPAELGPLLQENFLLTAFLQRLQTGFRAASADTGYIWSRDQLPGQRHQIYRLAFVVANMPDLDFSRCMLDAANLWCYRIWNMPASKNLVVTWPECGAILDRNRADHRPNLEACFLAASQLARSDTKTLGKGRVRNFNSSWV